MVQFTEGAAVPLEAVVAVALAPPALLRGAARDGAPIGSRVITSATGVGFAPRRSTASNTSTPARTIRRRRIPGTTLK
ncbi:MAG: hypothetical protein ACM4AI_07850 [Acidobacteriota bacterium]